MSDELTKSAPVWRKPLLCIIAIAIALCMVRLGFWQLGRAEQKRNIVNQQTSRAEQAAMPIEMVNKFADADEFRFRQVLLSGHYLSDSDLFVDNQVINGQVGYQVFTPFKLAGSDIVVLIARGWTPVGESRNVLPKIITNPDQLVLEGRLNRAPAKPPLWSDKYDVSNGSVWQYLPISDVANVLDAQVFPLVVELAPSATDSADLVRKWPEINDQWVAKHQGYAFQWFAMAGAFFVACLALLVRGAGRK